MLKFESFSDDIRPRHKLCSNPKDHMGSCGGSKGSYGSVKAGVCLVETYSSQQLCKYVYLLLLCGLAFTILTAMPFSTATLLFNLMKYLRSQ